ncbi:MAG: PD40 domain-containing protein, partial [Bacteroidia bacterium]|nr:PD40 domain-containing protein [Bacteroidia bacterium]
MLELKNSPDKKSLLYLVTLLFCLPFYLFAQKKEQEKQAQIYYETADYYHALNTYKNLLINDTSNAQYAVRIAACMFYLKQSPDSILPYLQKASNKKLDESFYYLGKIYHLQNKFDEAINAYNIYLNTSQNRLLNNSIMQRELEITKTAKELFKRPVASTITNMGASINSKESDYAPLLTADENTIYFTSRRPETTGGKQDELGNYFEDIYTSHKNSKEWVAAKNLGAPVNSPTNDACTGISPDGQSLIIYRTQPNK